MTTTDYKMWWMDLDKLYNNASEAEHQRIYYRIMAEGRGYTEDESRNASVAANAAGIRAVRAALGRDASVVREHNELLTAFAREFTRCFDTRPGSNLRQWDVPTDDLYARWRDIAFTDLEPTKGAPDDELEVGS